MKQITPYTNFTSALEALDNGGRFYNLLTRAQDSEVTSAELAKVAGVFSDRQMMFLFLEMSIQDLDDRERRAVHQSLSEELQAERAEHAPQVLLPSEADERGEASRTAIITGIPRFVEDKTVFSGFIMVPIQMGKTMTLMMVPIMDQFDLYELSDGDSSRKTFISKVRGSARLPEVRARFGGVLKESTADEEGNDPDRLFLETAYYSPL